MSSTLPPVIVEIQLKQDQFAKALSEVQGKLHGAGQAAHETHAPFSKLGEGFKELAGMATKLFAVVEVFNFLKESTKVAAQNAESFKVMELQLTRVTGASKKQVEATDQQLESLSEVSGVLTTNIRPGFEKLVLATHNTTKALQLQKLAMDVSAATGKPLTAVSMALSKSYMGNDTMLNRLVPSAKNAADKFGYLQKTFKGSAEAAGDANPYGRLQVMMEKIKVSLGTALVPLIGTFSKILLKLMPVVNMLANIFSKVMDAVAPLIDALISALLPIVLSLVQAFLPLIDKILPIVMKLFKAILPVINIFAEYLAKYLIPIIGFLVEKLADLMAWNMDSIVRGFDFLVKLLTPFWNTVLKPMLDGLISLLGIKLSSTVDIKVDKSSVSKIADSLKGLNSQGAGTGGGSGGSKTKSPLEVWQAALAKYNKAVAALKTKFNADMESLLKDHNKAVADIVSNGVKSLSDIIKQSKSLLTDAFREVTKVDAGSMFMQAGANIGNMLSMLKNKLATGAKLAEDAGKLSGLGYSQEFVQSIVAQGPEIGDQLAQQLIAGGAGQAKELQGMFDQVQNQSAHGVDKLADDIFAKAGLATEELKNQYASAHADLVNALASENDAFAASSDSLLRTYKTTMAKLQIERDKARKAYLQTGGVTAAEGRQIRRIDKDIANQNNIIKGNVSPNININTSIEATTNATADAIARAVVDAIRFNAPVTAPATPGASNGVK